SLITRTSTLRRLSPSSIKAASTASSRVRPRPSADFIGMPPRYCSLLRPSGPTVLWHRLQARARLRSGPRTLPTLPHHRLRGPAATRISLRQAVAPPDHAVRLNDAPAGPDQTGP